MAKEHHFNPVLKKISQIPQLFIQYSEISQGVFLSNKFHAYKEINVGKWKFINSLITKIGIDENPSVGTEIRDPVDIYEKFKNFYCEFRSAHTLPPPTRDFERKLWPKEYFCVELSSQYYLILSHINLICSNLCQSQCILYFLLLSCTKNQSFFLEKQKYSY